MERKHCTSDDSNDSPYSNQSFLADRFAKKPYNLNIPDTIPENCSAELNEDNLKMEAPKVTAENFSYEDKENVCNNLQVKCNESVNSSTYISIDNSYIRQCERKLLESSQSEDDKSIESDKSRANVQFLDVQRKLIFNNDTISTPPSLLRKEISLLRNEMTEAHEFHDFEIQLLKEEKFNEIDSYDYLELFEKYSTLTELYATLKAEYDDYRKEQEKIRQEYQSKTADCLEHLCSQIEASDNSLNFSSASFVSFNGGIKSSTMMEDVSEVEATVVHDATVLANDPLSITNDVVFKTPMQTPLKCAKKFEEKMNSGATKSVVKEVKDIITEHENTVSLDSEHNIQLCNLETVLCDKIKDVENLEQRLFKVEDMSSVLQKEFERINTVYAKENNFMECRLKLANLKELENENIRLKELSEVLQAKTTKAEEVTAELENENIRLKELSEVLQAKTVKAEEVTAALENENVRLKELSEVLQAKTTKDENLISELENENIRLKELSEVLQAKTVKAEEVTAALENENVRLKELSEVLQAKTTKAEEVTAELENENIRLKELSEVLQAKTVKAEEVTAKVENENIRLKELSEVLQAKTVKAEEVTAELENENVRLKELSEVLQAKTTKDENLISELENENIRLKELSEVLQSKTTKAEKVTAELENENIRLKELSEVLQSKTTKAEEVTAELENENIRLKELSEVLQAKTAKDENVISELENEISHLKELSEVLQSKTTKAEEVTAELENENVRLKELYEVLQTKLKDDEAKVKDEHFISELENENIRLKELSEVLQAKTAKDEQVISELENEIAHLKELSEVLQAKTVKAEEVTPELENENIRLKELSEVLKAKSLKDENVISELENEISHLKELSEVLQVKTAKDEQVISELENENVRLKELSEVLQAKTTKDEQVISELENEISHLKELSEVLQVKTAKDEQVISELENENVRLKELSEVLQAKTAKAEDVISELNEEIRILKLNQASLLEFEELKKMFETLRNKFLDTPKTSLSLTEEIHILQTDILNMMQTREDLAAAEKILSEKLKISEIEKGETEVRCCELENDIKNLKQEIEAKENFLTEFKTEKSKIKMENDELKESYDALKKEMTEAKNVIFTKDEEICLLKSYKSELMLFKKDLVSANDAISLLKVQIKSIEVEKSEVENRCSELQESNQNLRAEITAAKNLENNPVYEKVQTENDDLKQKIFKSDKMITELKNELELAKKDQMNNFRKVEELIQEIEELKKENTDFSLALTTIEETQKNLENVLLDVEHDNCLTSDRIMQMIAQNTKRSDSETKQNKIVTDFVETITKTCKGVQNELIKKFDNKILQWESQRDIDSQNFQDQIKRLTEKKVEYEAAIKQKEDSLAAADDTISHLKSQLSVIQTEKTELENDRRKLEERNLVLQAEIDTKETIIKGLDELKLVSKKIEIENGDLKRQTLESEEIIVRLKDCLEMKNKEQSRNEIKIQELQSEIDLLKKEQEDLMTLSGRLESIEKDNKNLSAVFLDIQSHLGMPEDTLTKLMSGDFKNKKIFIEKINSFAKAQMEGLKAENKHLKCGIDNLKQKVKELTKLICETANDDLKEALSNLNSSHPNNMSLRSKSKSMDICVRRLDKLEEINHNLTEMLTRILSITEFPDFEKLKLCSARDFSNIMKKLVAHFQGLESKMKELREENAQLDEECETYANIIKDLKKEAAAVWKSNKEKTEEMESRISQLSEEKTRLENEKQDLLAKISKLESECQKLKSASKTEEPFHGSISGNETKKISELKRIILVKEQKLLELQDLEAQASSFKSQIEYLKTALEREKKKVGEEKEKSKKLQKELNELTKNLKTENKKAGENQILDELRMRGSISGGIVQEFVDKEKVRKLSKDIGILKELCRARYAEIKRLEAVNAALRNGTPKNSNQMDSPLRSRGYNTRSKNQVRDLWRPEINGKENGPV